MAWAKRERLFLAILTTAAILAALVANRPQIAMWVGFCFAAYSAIANDSIQTIGTFIASNRGRTWWQLWIFIGGIFAVTMAWSWFEYDGDVSHQRLMAKGFDEAPTEFKFLQLIAPLALVLLTRLRMPVSTTFLLLSCFAATGKSLNAVIAKSVTGYAIALTCSLLLWGLLGRFMDRRFQGEAHPGWRVAQWVTTGCLWSVWLQQDAANIAVFLPRSLSVGELIAFLLVPIIGLGYMFRIGGERIQEVVNEKASVVDVRAATVIDLLYAIILYIFKIQSKVPMSTTWVFLGLLAGRELAMTRALHLRPMKETSKIVALDGGKAVAGLVVSVVLAVVLPKIAAMVG